MTRGFKGFVDHDTPDIVCPTCTTVLDGSMNTQGERAPKDGDPTICVYCASLGVFEGGQLRNPNDDELVEFMRDPQIRVLQSVVRERMGDLRDR